MWYIGTLPLFGHISVDISVSTIYVFSLIVYTEVIIIHHRWESWRQKFLIVKNKIGKDDLKNNSRKKGIKINWYRISNHIVIWIEIISDWPITCIGYWFGIGIGSQSDRSEVGYWFAKWAGWHSPILFVKVHFWHLSDEAGLIPSNIRLHSRHFNYSHYNLSGEFIVRGRKK